MRDETRRDRMAAEVEIKVCFMLVKFNFTLVLTICFSLILLCDFQLRGIYFDRIERSEVEIVIGSIFKHVSSLEDMQFLVKYAAQV